LKGLQREFPEYDIEQIDLADLLQQNKALCLLNLFPVLWNYPKELLSRRRSFRECFYLTPFLFHGLKKAIAARVRPDTHHFSLQTQSLHDFSVPGVPHFVYTDHAHLTNLRYPAFDPTNLLPSKWIDLERSIYSNATRVFVMTHYVERTLLEDYGCDPSKVLCIPAGGNTVVREITPEQDRARQLRVLFVGVNWKRKGGPELLEAFLKIVDRFPEAKLVVVGCNPPVQHPNVEILGKVPLERVEQEYLKAQFFAFPTRIEPVGFVVIEALMNKLPVIGTPIGILPDMITDGEDGYLVPSDDVHGLANAMAELLQDPAKCRQMGENGYRVARDRTWEAAAAALRKEINRVLNAP